MFHKIFTIGEFLKDVHFQDLSIEEIQVITQEQIPLLLSQGRIKSADNAGSPANLAAYTSLLGGETVLLASIGMDAWGYELENFVKDYSVRLILTKNKSQHSDSALIYLDEQRIPHFVKFLLPALPLINEQDIFDEDIAQADFVHVSMMASAFLPSRTAIDSSVQKAKYYSKILSFDANLRCGVYSTSFQMYEQMKKFLKESDIIKLSAAELLFFVQMDGLDITLCENDAISFVQLMTLSQKVRDFYMPKLLLVTLGSAGALGFSGSSFSWSSSYFFGPTKNTLGAGDAFMAASIKKYFDFGKETLSEEELNELLIFACRISGISVTGEETIVDKVKDHCLLFGDKNHLNYDSFVFACEKQLLLEQDSCRKLLLDY